MQRVAFRVATGAGQSAKLAFVPGLCSTADCVAITPAVKVAVEGASGNTETGDNAAAMSRLHTTSQDATALGD
jgi:hypothetical protein